MKFIICLALIGCCLAGLRVQAPSAHDNLTIFLNNAFSSLNLSSPTNIINCFDEQASSDFFQWVINLQNREADLSEQNFVSYQKYQTLFSTYTRKLNSNFACAAATSDFAGLLTKLKIPTFYNNLTLLESVYGTYGTQNCDHWADQLSPVKFDIWKDAYDKAGAAAGTFLKGLSTTAFDPKYMIFAQVENFYRGVFLSNNLGYGFDFRGCLNTLYNSGNLANITVFYSTLSNLVVRCAITGNVLGCVKDFFQNAGAALNQTVPSSLWTCINATKSAQNFYKKFGFTTQLLDPTMEVTMTNYISTNLNPYQLAMAYVSNQFNSTAYLGAGIAYGTLLWAMKQSNATGPTSAIEV